MKKIVLLIFAFSLLSCNQHKVAYVDVEVLMNDYKATKALEEVLKLKQAQKTKEFDSLQKPFNEKVQRYYQTAQGMSAAKRQEMELELQKEQQQLQLLQQQNSQDLQVENTERSEALMKKIDSFVSDYAKANDLNIVFGTQGKGTILYADESLDVTNELLEILNTNFDSDQE
ncbi:MAG TPA: OmpH family outer membrane protein [Flavobacteriaceae bacterium]|nr:OmpH family outer membrane protein [Flavobacteriaceae bacterium]